MMLNELRVARTTQLKCQRDDRDLRVFWHVIKFRLQPVRVFDRDLNILLEQFCDALLADRRASCDAPSRCAGSSETGWPRMAGLFCAFPKPPVSTARFSVFHQRHRLRPAGHTIPALCRTHSRTRRLDLDPANHLFREHHLRPAGLAGDQPPNRQTHNMDHRHVHGSRRILAGRAPRKWGSGVVHCDLCIHRAAARCGTGNASLHAGRCGRHGC